MTISLVQHVGLHHLPQSRSQAFQVASASYESFILNSQHSIGHTLQMGMLLREGQGEIADLNVRLLVNRLHSSCTAGQPQAHAAVALWLCALLPKAFGDSDMR